MPAGGTPVAWATMVLSVSGMDNKTENIGSQAQVTGYFSNLSNGRGEITINITKNESYMVNYPEKNVTEVPSSDKEENITEPVPEISGKIREWSIVGAGIVFIVLIYIFKVRKN